MTTVAHDLVEQMVQAGARPEPALLEQILEQGEAAVEPLRDILRRDLRGWPAEAALTFATSLLSDLRAQAAIPDIVDLLHRDYDELLDGMSDELGRFGPAIVAPLLEVIRHQTLDWYARAVAIEGARNAAGSDLAQRATIAETLRTELSNYLEQTERDDDDELPTFLVIGLAELADPLARDLIAAAFARDLVDRTMINEKYAGELYASGGRFIDAPTGRSIDDYKRQYEKQREGHGEIGVSVNEFRREQEAARRAVTTEMSDDPSPEPPNEPIRRQAFRPGRNDPCWCGSGKKYKKCHLAADEASGA